MRLFLLGVLFAIGGDAAAQPSEQGMFFAKGSKVLTYLISIFLGELSVDTQCNNAIRLLCPRMGSRNSSVIPKLR